MGHNCPLSKRSGSWPQRQLNQSALRSRRHRPGVFPHRCSPRTASTSQHRTVCPSVSGTVARPVDAICQSAEGAGSALSMSERADSERIAQTEVICASSVLVPRNAQCLPGLAFRRRRVLLQALSEHPLGCPLGLWRSHKTGLPLTGV